MSIARLLQASARTLGDRPAVSVADQRVHDYRSLALTVARLAGGLRALPHVAAGDRIALVMANCPQYVELLWACWHAGLCVVPINAKLHPREVAFILENCGVRYCFATSTLAAALASLVSEVEVLQRVIDAESAEYRRLAAAKPIALQSADETAPAWLFYTSGTTGRPKGATLTHRNLLAMALRYYADMDQLTAHDAMVVTGPMSHATGLNSIPHLARGSHLVVPASREFQPAEVFDLVALYPNACLFAAPTMLTRLVDDPTSRAAKIENIRTIVYGGAPMYFEDLKRALDRFGPRLWQGYGQGETPNTISYVSKETHAQSSHPRFAQRLSSVGVARTGVEVKVVDEDGVELPPGDIGEVVCRSDVTMQGYWNNPEATAKALRDGWLWTGDLGTFDEDGFLTLKDRSKDLIISGGSNVYPREVEEVLLRHPDVHEVSVIGRRHAQWGEEVVAFVVCRAGRTVDTEALDRLCLESIARFKRPRAYCFVDGLPKSNYGKILKTALRAMLEADRAQLERAPAAG